MHVGDIHFIVLRLKPEKLEKELNMYSENAKKMKGKRLSLKEFAEYLEVPVSDMLGNMFALFDDVRNVTTERLKLFLLLDLNSRHLFQARMEF